MGPFIQKSFIDHQHIEGAMLGTVAGELKHSSDLLYSLTSRRREKTYSVTVNQKQKEVSLTTVM